MIGLNLLMGIAIHAVLLIKVMTTSPMSWINASRAGGGTIAGRGVAASAGAGPANSAATFIQAAIPRAINAPWPKRAADAAARANTYARKTS
jgi:hypothetical protein